MKFKLLVAVLLAVGSLSAQAATSSATSMSITGGSFNLGGAPGTPGSWSLSVSNLLSGYQNLGSAFTFFGSPVYLYTSDGTSGTTPYNTATPAPGGAVPTAMLDTTAHTITADLSAWTASWGITNFNQGTSSATGTWDPTTGVYNIGWASTVVGGAFAGQTGNWTLQGVAAVPEPETYAMMLAGLALVGVSARRKASKRVG